MHPEELEALGLNKNEAIIFHTLIVQGEATAGTILRVTGFHRNIVYDNIDKLIERGLVTFAYHEKKRVFKPTKATALCEMVEQKLYDTNIQLEKAKQVSTEIQKILSKQKPSLKTTVYQGKQALREILLDVIETKEYHGIGISNASVEVLGETFWKNFIQRVKANNVKEWLLLNNDFDLVAISSPKLTKTRRLPPEVNLITEILIYGNKVAIMIYTNPPVATVIEDEHAAASFRSYFNVLWKQAK